MKRFFKLTDVINPPGAGLTNKTRFELVPGWRYFKAEIRGYCGAAVTMDAGVSSIRLLLGSGSGDNVQSELTPTELNEHNSLFSPDRYGASVEGGGNIDTPGETWRLPIWFLDAERSQFLAQERTVLDLVAMSAFIEVQSAAAVTAGVTYEVWVLAEPHSETLRDIQANRAAPLNVVPGTNIPNVTILESTVKNFNANFLELTDLARDRDYFAFHFYNPVGATITEVIAKINGVEIWNATKASIDSLLRGFDMHPVANRLSIIPDLVGKTSDAWNLDGITKENFKIRLNLSASVNSAVKVVTARVGKPK